ncbi:ATP-dependent endonuclease [Streptomyces sp. NPDC047980]|uniref:ATP-dependent nuclease n=1 Tax=Streptomyces sp. NPDC047980 TaxID=3365494 RepID=UPI0037105F4C
MYLATLTAENFRVFGARRSSEDAGDSLELELTPGVSVLLGENDAGKTAVVDAIRLCLLTTAADFYRVARDDFHAGPGGRTDTFTITCRFKELSTEEQGIFLEHLTTDPNGTSSLYITFKAELMEPLPPHRVSVTTRTGPNGEGPTLDGAAREHLKATYLRPLRDAEGELRAGRGSRLSQILAGYPTMKAEGANDFDVDNDTAITLVGIMRRAEHHIRSNSTVMAALDDINSGYLEKFSIGSDTLRGEIGVAGDATLSRALERLELRLSTGESEWTRRGLGYNNALFMAAELLLLGNNDVAPLLLIEEPEAHLHPQLQTRVMDLLLDRAAGGESAADPRVQVILTTHSPHLASAVPVEWITLVAAGRTFSLAPGMTGLDPSDYAFLSKFLDATKANLFFARSVALVEGDAEALLLPALAAAAGWSFSENGVSIVNVGHTGLFRYSHIFKRDGQQIPVSVACIRDRDLLPPDTPEDMRGQLPSVSTMTSQQVEAHVTRLKSGDAGPVRTFVSDQWTLEYDLAAASWPLATVMHQAVCSAWASTNKWPTGPELVDIQARAAEEIAEWRKDETSLDQAAMRIYRPLRRKPGKQASKAVSAQYAAQLLTPGSLARSDLPLYLRDAFSHLCGGG